MMRILWIIVAVLVIVAGARQYFVKQNAGGLLRFEGVAEPVRVSIADTPAEREQGLSGRPSLSEDEGMLFIFEAPGKPSFWMKDMRFPIDIIWISSDWKVSDITPRLAPDTYPTAFAPSAEAQYVLEVPAGFVDIFSIDIGQSITFDRN